MNLVIEKLYTTYDSKCDQEGTLSLVLCEKKLSWHKLVDDHLLLTLEYSLLCQQIRDNNTTDITNLIQQVEAAYFLGKLLEAIYNETHLNVPREVARLGNHRKAYQQLLPSHKTEYLNSIFNTLSVEKKLEEKTFWANLYVLSLADWIREKTFRSNLFRLFAVRFRRFLDTIRLAELGSVTFGNFTEAINRYAIPFFTWFAWIFFLPRFLISCVVLFKNTFYTENMSEEQRALGYFERFVTQVKRRWFHLGNDSVWIFVGLLNCFILTGTLSPIGTALALAAFLYDVVLAMINLSIEMYRLHLLKNQYKQMKQTPQIIQQLDYIDERILFEAKRLGITLLSTMFIVLAASLALPVFASVPIIPLIGAILLVLISLGAFATNALVNKYRPKDTIDDKTVECLQNKIGFFAQNKQNKKELFFPNLDDTAYQKTRQEKNPCKPGEKRNSIAIYCLCEIPKSNRT